MAYTSTQLITNSYYGSQIVSREFQTVSGSQISDGLNWLNDIIGEKVVDEGMIPYESTYTFNAVVGQEQYVIPNLIQINTLVFYLNQVRYAMKFNKRNAYFGTPRANNIISLPYQWYFEKQLGGGNLYIYFLPDRNYPMQIHGIFRLSEVTLGQDLSLILDRFYITYLGYALTDRICANFGYDTPPNIINQLNKYESWINKKSRVMDLSITKNSTLQQKGPYNWAFINLSQGWVAPS